MIAPLDAHRAEIIALCRRLHVRRLEVFGSAACGGHFDPVRSDIGLRVTYDPVIADAVRNPFVRANIERWQEPLYAA